MKTNTFLSSNQERPESKKSSHFWSTFKDNWQHILPQCKHASQKKKTLSILLLQRKLETKTYWTMQMICAMLSILNIPTAQLLEREKLIYSEN